MSIDVSAEQLAELFHHYHHILTCDSTASQRQGSVEWSEMSAQERERLVAATQLALSEIDARTEERTRAMRYFAKPGQAEWGC
jgi:hypothetical protein